LSSAGDSGNTWSRSRVRCARSAEAPKLASAKHESQATRQEAPLPDRLLHDVGAFQIGIGVSVLLSLMWSDSIGVALVGFIVAGAIHSINHALDRHLGGHPLDQWELAGLVLVALGALIVHLWGARGKKSDR
jgi:uncharacterized protein YjeT (DUF2065 family)